MYVKNVAIVSGNATLTRFLSLECRLRDCTVQSYTKMPSDIDEYDRVLVDADTVRRYGTDPRIVVVSSKHTSADARSLPWPMAIDELALSLRDAAIVREDDTVSMDAPILWVQNWERRELRFGCRIIELSEREWMLLLALAKNAKTPVSRESLMQDFEADGGNIVDVYVCHLRKKLEQLCDRRVIATVRGVGYRLELPVREEEIK